MSRLAAASVALLLACGKPPGLSGGLEVDVNYTLLGGNAGCVLLRAAPFAGSTGESSKSLDGLPRSGTLKFGVGRAADWTSPEVTLFALLYATSCDGGTAVDQKSVTRNFPSGAVETVMISLAQDAGTGGGSGTAGGGSAGGAGTAGGTAGGGRAGGSGTAGGGTAGGGTAGGVGTAGGGTAGGGTAGGVGTAGGGTAGGGTAGGGTAGGGTAGGGTAGGATPSTCDGGFVRITTQLTGTNRGLAIVDTNDVWVGSSGSPRVARIVNGTASSPGMNACTVDVTGAWARRNGRVYLAGGTAVYTLDSVLAGTCTSVETFGGNVTDVWGTPATGTQQYIFGATSNGQVGYYGDGVSFTRMDEQVADELHAIEGFSTTNVFAAGRGGGGSSRGAIYHFDGSNWSNSYQDSNNGTVFFTLSFVSPTLGWAGGQGSRLMRWNGTSWTADMNIPGGFTNVIGLKAFSANAIYAVGDSDQIMKWNGSAWVSVGSSSPVTSLLEQVRGTSECDLWVVGRNGYVGTTNQ